MDGMRHHAGEQRRPRFRREADRCQRYRRAVAGVSREE